MRNKKSFFTKFFTRKLNSAIFTLTFIFLVYTIYNIIINICGSIKNIQRFFKNFIISILIYLTIITLLLLLKLVIERFKNITGSKIRFRLTFLFIFVALIPAVVLTISSNYLINEAMTRISPQEGIIKPLENSLIFYRRNLSNEISKNLSNILNNVKNKSTNEIIEIIKKMTLHDIDILLLFQLLKNNHQILYFYKTKNFNLAKKNFYIEYFDESEIDEPVIHKLDKEKWIIFSIRFINKEKKIYILIGSILDKEKISVAEGISAILERYKSLKIISVSLIQDFQVFILFISLPIILLAVIFGFYFANDFTKPINSLVEGTKKISKGIYGYNINIKGSDELSQLVNAFNSMSHELYLNKNRLYEAEKLAAWREVAKKIAHEVKNPLTPIKLAAERLIRAYVKDSKNFNEILQKCSMTISNEVDRLTDLVNEFSQFARLPLTKLQEENFVSLLNELINIYKETYQNIEFNYVNYLSMEDCKIKIDKNQIKQVLINLIENAIESKAKKITFITECIFKKSNKFLKFTISDNGVGIPKKYQSFIFETHFTSKQKGSGLGLSIVKNIIDEHKGIIYFNTEENFGTSFFIELPYEWRDYE